jgi:hypothetical protein
MTDRLRILGIDPGMKGALARITVSNAGRESLDWIDDMPIGPKGFLNPAALRERVEDQSLDGVALELVRSMPGQGVASTFKFGAGWGGLHAAFGMYHRLYEPTPRKWKAEWRLGKNKGEARALASRLWPEHAQLFHLVKHDGRAEAALIALATARIVQRGEWPG